jgi:hypothetical protein
MANGFVYVLTNEMMPNLVKVGKTSRAVDERVNSLSSATGVPTSFTAFKSYEVIDCDVAEALAHSVLETTVGRPNKNREFFNGPPDIICTILDDVLSSHCVGADHQLDLSRFDNLLPRVARKEFTMACIEFEEAFAGWPQSTVPSGGIGPRLERIMGAYVACCCTTAREPIIRRFMEDVRLRSPILSSAVEVMSAWVENPVDRLLPFFRKFSPEPPDVAENRLAVVVRDVSVRARPSGTAEVISTLQRGLKVATLGYSGNWKLVQIDDKKVQPRQGWVYHSVLQYEEDSDKPPLAIGDIVPAV